MSELKVNIDVSGLTQYLENFAKEITKDLQKGIKGLAVSTHAHIVKEAGEKLDKWDLDKYKKNLGQAEQINEYLWEITLDTPAVGIEEGREAWDMKGEPGKWGLLKKPTGYIKDPNNPDSGKAYRIIPMTQGKESSTMDSAKLERQEMLVRNIKDFLKSRNIPIKKIENETAVGRKTGQTITRPKIGRVAGPFNIESGAPPGAGNTPQLDRLNIYQKINSKGTVQRVMTTFRTAVEGDGKWEHKAVEAKNLFKEAEDWATREWENVWLPQIIEKYKGK